MEGNTSTKPSEITASKGVENAAKPATAPVEQATPSSEVESDDERETEYNANGSVRMYYSTVGDVGTGPSEEMGFTYMSAGLREALDAEDQAADRHLNRGGEESDGFTDESDFDSDKSEEDDPEGLFRMSKRVGPKRRVNRALKLYKKEFMNALVDSYLACDRLFLHPWGPTPPGWELLRQRYTDAIYDCMDILISQELPSAQEQAIRRAERKASEVKLEGIRHERNVLVLPILTALKADMDKKGKGKSKSKK